MNQNILFFLFIICYIILIIKYYNTLKINDIIILIGIIGILINILLNKLNYNNEHSDDNFYKLFNTD